jgi:hypothetical protein
VERITRRVEEITLRRWEDLLSSLSKRFGPLSGKVVFLAREAEAIFFFHLQMRGIALKWSMEAGDLRVIEEYRKIKEVVEKIRYGQYL